jgi:hypothetical protein
LPERHLLGRVRACTALHRAVHPPLPLLMPPLSAAGPCHDPSDRGCPAWPGGGNFDPNNDSRGSKRCSVFCCQSTCLQRGFTSPVACMSITYYIVHDFWLTGQTAKKKNRPVVPVHVAAYIRFLPSRRLVHANFLGTSGMIQWEFSCKIFLQIVFLQNG